MARKTYVEPDDYFPKELRKEFGLGEFFDEKKNEEQKKREKENKKFRKALKGE